MPQGEVEEYEDSHVHQVYEKIASHFSSTRYKVSSLSDTLTGFISETNESDNHAAVAQDRELLD